ncbi:MAG: hypothetical protein KA392_01155 [Candidatus Obscuribacter sp.]|jgi:hypothetical protein|nr:hypothetical protein [Candidatus Obscuribacter sp.]MBP6591530.1 hypothetical protein [Candidatus Obscuribacter sp.]MBP7575319.1 hypothetical protein [Candidatus Obscuribacter sp.]
MNKFIAKLEAIRLVFNCFKVQKAAIVFLLAVANGPVALAQSTFTLQGSTQEDAESFPLFTRQRFEAGRVLGGQNVLQVIRRTHIDFADVKSAPDKKFSLEAVTRRHVSELYVESKSHESDLISPFKSGHPLEDLIPLKGAVKNFKLYALRTATLNLDEPISRSINLDNPLSRTIELDEPILKKSDDGHALARAKPVSELLLPSVVERSRAGKPDKLRPVVDRKRRSFPSDADSWRLGRGGDSGGSSAKNNWLLVDKPHPLSKGKSQGDRKPIPRDDGTLVGIPNAVSNLGDVARREPEDLSALHKAPLELVIVPSSKTAWPDMAEPRTSDLATTSIKRVTGELKSPLSAKARELESLVPDSKRAKSDLFGTVKKRPDSLSAVALPMSAEESISWDKWYLNLNALVNPKLIECMESNDNPAGKNSIRVTVTATHKLTVELLQPSNKSFDDAILSAYRYLDGNELLVFPPGSKRNSVSIIVESQRKESGPISQVHSNPIVGDKESASR